MRTIKYVIPDSFDGKMVKVFLRRGNGFSAASVNKVKNYPGGLLLNGEFVKSVGILHTGDELTVTFPPEENGISPSDYSSLDVVYEDEDVLVINKPAGLAMHPTHNHQGDTLANMVAGYLADRGKNGLFRAVGRLDKCTSGLVLCALNSHSASFLSGKYEKTYFALACGEYSGSGTIDIPIYRPEPMKTLRAAGEGGERAVTHWTALCSSGGLSLLRVRLETGRTHQIRVHFSALGTPLAGDTMYGAENLCVPRAALHCGIIEFTHPVTGEAMRFTAPLPGDMLSAVSEAGMTVKDGLC